MLMTAVGNLTLVFGLEPRYTSPHYAVVYVAMTMLKLTRMLNANQSTNVKKKKHPNCYDKINGIELKVKTRSRSRRRRRKHYQVH